MAGETVGLQAEKGLVEILDEDSFPEFRRDILRLVTLAALNAGVFSGELESRLRVIEGRFSRRRPANQLKVAARVFLMTGRAGGVALLAVDNARVISAPFP
jgi:hypothetical protein